MSFVPLPAFHSRLNLVKMLAFVGASKQFIRLDLHIYVVVTQKSHMTRSSYIHIETTHMIGSSQLLALFVWCVFPLVFMSPVVLSTPDIYFVFDCMCLPLCVYIYIYILCPHLLSKVYIHCIYAHACIPRAVVCRDIRIIML